LESAVREVNTVPTTPSPIERIFEESHALVFRTAYRITGNAADAEDVLQQVFLRLIRRGNTAEPLDNQESYLRRAAINAALDVIRARQDARAGPLDETTPVPADQNELRDSLRHALAALNPRAAELFALRFFEGYANPEIARMLGMSQVHVAVSLYRTRKQLQKEIASQTGGKL
jgi:RNA polymerase sigma-70 factor (ECF subfamily)